MKRSTTAAGVTLLLVLARAASATAAHAAPPPGDILGSYLEHRAWMEAGAIRPRSNDAVRLSFLADSSSPISALDFSFAVFEGDAWNAARDHQYRDGHPMNQSQAMHALAWDLGMTRASEPWSVPSVRTWAGIDANAQAQAKKAGLDEDIFLKARAIVPGDASALPANYAVAAMLLREKSAAVRTQAERAARGLDDGVLRRFLAARAPADILPGDAAYLMILLEGELSRWAAGGTSNLGYRQLPTPLRLARAAAAYRDDRGYTGDPPCASRRLAGDAAIPSGEVASGTQRCLADLTDQDLYTWYRRSFEGEMPAGRGVHIQNHLIDALRAVHPLWVPPLRPWAISAAARVEIVQYLAVRSGPLDARSEQADSVLSRRARKTAMGVAKP